MKTIVLDDDPTGTQSATGVPVLLELAPDTGVVAQRLTEVLATDDAVYVLTNSRAVDESEAVRLLGRIREAGADVATRLGASVRFVLRGDSTLRGHVFAESDAFATDDSVMLFVPAFPAGGRTTSEGVHYVRVGDAQIPAAETEYAQDPVFGFHSSDMHGYVREQGGGRKALTVPLGQIRASSGQAVADALVAAAPGTVVAPDAVTDEDVDLIHRGLETAWATGRDIVVRCASPLAARCAEATSTGLLPRPLNRPAGPVLVVCGSHTSGATEQLAALETGHGIRPVVLDTDLALTDPEAAGADLVERVRADLQAQGVAALSSQRHRRAEDNTLDHGERVMAALTTTVRHLSGEVAAVVAKGGITSAEVARSGMGADLARVRGQLLPGISVWDLNPQDDDPIPYVVVPGNVGDAGTLVDVLHGLEA